MYSKYSGAGNDFVVIDGRGLSSGVLEDFRSAVRIRELCAREGTDGLMILMPPVAAGSAFVMEYYNSDGSGGMMCGNGGRCIVAFAASLGIAPSAGRFCFTAPDGPHEAELLPDGRVRLKMSDAALPREVSRPSGAFFMNTGTRHLVISVKDVEAADVEGLGREIRNYPEFAPEGVNVNFVSKRPDGSLVIRTYEKGVEAETLACGTGAVAAALASGLPSPVLLRARGGELVVEFEKQANKYESVYLTGPVMKVF